MIVGGGKLKAEYQGVVSGSDGGGLEGFSLDLDGEVQVKLIDEFLLVSSAQLLRLLLLLLLLLLLVCNPRRDAMILGICPLDPTSWHMSMICGT